MNRVASDFSGQTWKGEPINLSQYKGKKIWLAFFRYSSCPLCNLRISEMITNYEKWQQKNLEILAVFQSGPDNIKRYVGKQEPPYPIPGNKKLLPILVSAPIPILTLSTLA